MNSNQTYVCLVLKNLAYMMKSNQTYVCLVLKNLAYMMNSNQTYVCLVLKNLAYMMNSNQSNCAHSKFDLINCVVCMSDDNSGTPWA